MLFDVLSQSPGARTLQSMIVPTLQALDVNCTRVLSLIHDGAAVNNACARGLLAAFPRCYDQTCVSHTINLVGQQLEKAFPTTLEPFMSTFNSMIAKSAYARNELPFACHKHSQTRWFSLHNQWSDVLNHWNAVIKMVEDNDIDCCSTYRTTMRGLLHQTATSMNELHMQLAVCVDLGKYLYKNCYIAEYREPIACFVFEWLYCLNIAMQQFFTGDEYPYNAPTTMALAEQLHPPNVTARAYARCFINHLIPVRDKWALYWNRRDGHTQPRPGSKTGESDFVQPRLETIFRVFQPFGILQPLVFASLPTVQQQSNAVVALGSVCVFRAPSADKSWNNDEMKQGLLDELPVYAREAKDAPKMNPLQLHEWWQKRASMVEMRHYVEAYSVSIVLQPTSTLCERAIGLLRHMMTAQRESTLTDYRRLCIMRHCNELQRCSTGLTIEHDEQLEAVIDDADE